MRNGSSTAASAISEKRGRSRTAISSGMARSVRFAAGSINSAGWLGGTMAAVERRSREAAAMNTEVVVTCAVTGSGDSVGKHPAIPVTPEQIAGGRDRGGAGGGRGGAHPCPRPADRQGGAAARALPRGGAAGARLGRGRDPQPHRRHGRRLRPRRERALARCCRHRHGLDRRPAGACRGAAAGDLHARLRQHELRHVGLCQHARHAPRHGRPDQGGGREARDGGVRAGPCLAGQDAGRGGADRGAAAVPAVHGHPLRCRGRPARGAGDARHAAGGCGVRRVRHRADADADGGAGGADGRACPGRARGQSLARQGGLRVERRPGDSAPARSCG